MYLEGLAARLQPRSPPGVRASAAVELAEVRGCLLHHLPPAPHRAHLAFAKPTPRARDSEQPENPLVALPLVGVGARPAAMAVFSTGARAPAPIGKSPPHAPPPPPHPPPAAAPRDTPTGIATARGP